MKEKKRGKTNRIAITDTRNPKTNGTTDLVISSGHTHTHTQRLQYNGDDDDGEKRVCVDINEEV